LSRRSETDRDAKVTAIDADSTPGLRIVVVAAVARRIDRSGDDYRSRARDWRVDYNWARAMGVAAVVPIMVPMTVVGGELHIRTGMIGQGGVSYQAGKG
jgi:hypothetical protein